MAGFADTFWRVDPVVSGRNQDFGADALLGGSQVCLLLASAVTAAISMFAYKNSWEILEFCILDNIRAVGSAILICCLSGR